MQPRLGTYPLLAPGTQTGGNNPNWLLVLAGLPSQPCRSPPKAEAA